MPRCALFLVLFASTCLAKDARSPAPTSRYFVPTVKLDSEVTGESVELLQAEIAAATVLGAKAVILEIDSPGGSINAGFKLVKTIEESPIPVVCVVDDTAASMAAYILESCQVRIMTKRSKLMFHEPSFGGDFSGQPTSWRSMTDWLEATSRGMAEHMAQHMNVTVPFILDKVRGGAMWWMTWEDATKYAAVDFVVGGVKEVQDSHANYGRAPAH